MERLTVPAERLPDGGTRIQVVDARAVKEHAMELYWRLKNYEDTGLSPDDVTDLMGSHAVAIGELAKVPEWIPVGERLPESDKAVLVSAKCKTFGFRHTTEDYGWQEYEGDTEYAEEQDCFWIPECWWEDNFMDGNSNWIIDSDVEVTHWMPLSEPPKEEKK